MRNKGVFFALFFLGIAAASHSLDYGLILYQTPKISGQSGDTSFGYKGTFLPWLSHTIGDGADLYFSAGFAVNYQAEKWTYVPELYRFEAAFRPFTGLHIKAGRIQYSDPLGYIAEGLFDGASASVNLGKTRLSAGVYYTGFLFKETANITMNGDDQDRFNSDFDYGDFEKTYFAPRRLVAALDWDYPALFTPRDSLRAGILSQTDFTGSGDKIHSQYLSVKYSLPFLGQFRTDIGAAAELLESPGDLSAAFAASLYGIWTPAITPINDQLSLGFKGSSGSYDGTKISAFRPVTTETQGRILQTKLSGVASVDLSYTARIISPLSVEFQALYFIKTDRETFTGTELDGGSDSYFVGGEFNGAVYWAPVSDISLILGGGIFLPRTGTVFNQDAKPRWELSLGVLLSI
jgi:hypothetical protein